MTSPLLDLFRAELAAAVRRRGECARLARYMAERTGIRKETAACRISRILAGGRPGGETVLAVQEWMARKAEAEPRKGAVR